MNYAIMHVGPLELQVNCRKGQVAFRTRESAHRKKNTSHENAHIGAGSIFEFTAYIDISLKSKEC
jgi:hypothetical protein